MGSMCAHPGHPGQKSIPTAGRGEGGAAWCSSSITTQVAKGDDC